MPDQKRPKRRDPHPEDCSCGSCTRRRKKKALAVRDGGGGEALESKEIIEADLPKEFVISGNSHRHRVAQYVMYKQQYPKMTNIDIAEKMGIAVSHLNTLLHRARKAGWLRFDDPYSRIEHELIPKVMDNLSEFLDKKDKIVTLETAKNTVFKVYQERQGVQAAPNTVLAIKIETPKPGEEPAVTGVIIGQAREVKDGETE